MVSSLQPTKIIHFTAPRSRVQRPPAIKIGNTFLPVEESTKFLGLRWDSRLSFKKHISVLKTQCREALNLIRVVAHLGGGGGQRHTIYLQMLLDNNECYLCIWTIETCTTPSIYCFVHEASFLPSGIVVACFCVSVRVCGKYLLVCVITHHPFKVGSPNLDHRCKRPWLRSLLFFWGYWPWPSRSNLTSKSKFTPFWACPRNNSSPVQARIDMSNST